MSDPETQNVADAVRKAFRATKAQQSGRPYRPMARWDDDAVWLKIAACCQQHEADPANWVAAAFQYNKVPGGPFPNQLAGAAAARWYHELVKSSSTSTSGEAVDLVGDEVTREVQSVVERFLMQGCAPKDLLGDPCLYEIPAYVRLIMLPDDPDIFGKFGREAHGQITANPRLFEVLVRKGYRLDWLEKVAN